MTEQDQLFPVPETPPNRLAAARTRFKAAKAAYEKADSGSGFIDTAIYNEFLDARAELALAELEIYAKGL